MTDIIERLCREMHDRYEAAAVSSGWETQERSRRPWEDVPEANKATMRAAVAPIADEIARLKAEIDKFEVVLVNLNAEVCHLRAEIARRDLFAGCDGCSTGDCPHDTVHECCAHQATVIAEQAARIEGFVNAIDPTGDLHRRVAELEAALPATAGGEIKRPGDSVWLGDGEPTEMVVAGWHEWDPSNQCWSTGWTAVRADTPHRWAMTADVDCCWSTRREAEQYGDDTEGAAERPKPVPKEEDH